MVRVTTLKLEMLFLSVHTLHLYHSQEREIYRFPFYNNLDTIFTRIKYFAFPLVALQFMVNFSIMKCIYCKTL